MWAGVGRARRSGTLRNDTHPVITIKLIAFSPAARLHVVTAWSPHFAKLGIVLSLGLVGSLGRYTGTAGTLLVRRTSLRQTGTVGGGRREGLMSWGGALAPH